MNAILFCSLLFTALALAGGFAHVFELPNKINLNADDYLTVQQIYRGWSLLGIVVFGCLISTLTLIFKTRRNPRVFRFAIVAFLCIVAAQVIFWVFTFPANQQTQNWTRLPDNWLQLRTQWEYSHAAGAALNMAAFIVLLLATLRSRA